MNLIRYSRSELTALRNLGLDEETLEVFADVLEEDGRVAFNALVTEHTGVEYLGPTLIDRINELANDIHRKGGQPRQVMLHPDQFAALHTQLEYSASRTGTSAGLPTALWVVTGPGYVRVIADPACPVDRMFITKK